MSFWLGALSLLIAALGFVLAPAIIRQGTLKRAPKTNLAVAALLVPFTLALYSHVTTWSADPSANTELPAVADMVQGLAERLATNPNDPDGWRLLGQSYLALGRFVDARDALRQAWQRTPMPDDELRVARGEAEALADRESLRGEAGALFDEVLRHDPTNQKALWYGGLAALMTEKPTLARERWSALLELGPPEQVAQVLREQVQALGGTVESVADAAAAEPAEESGVRLLISVAEDLDTGDLGDASLFIFARSPDGGPPIAVQRRAASELPGDFRLSDANSMTGQSLANFETIAIVARISRSGQPTEQPGDLYGRIDFRPGQDLETQPLLIDQVVQ
jgi:cytochrome c-type biogenesis protein CcmH